MDTRLDGGPGGVADKEVAQSAHSLMVWQVRFSLASSVVAAIGLFVGGST
jgi:hypothetical protein